MTTQTVKQSLKTLQDPERPRRGLPAAAEKPAIGEAPGFASPQPAASPGGASAGIASPLRETSAAARTYHNAQDVFTEDGDIVKVWPIRFMRSLDADGNTFEQYFEMPDYSAITAP
jgi:hypothetical protein